MKKTVDDDNFAAASFLEDYFDPAKARDFAVLIDGPWGSGKTFFIKNFLTKYPQHLYVSLYGMSDVQQIDNELYRQLHPVLSSKKLRLVGRLAKGLVKGVLKVDLDGDGKDDGSVRISIPDVNLKEELINTEGYVLVFDDLERCSIPVSQVLGYINAFVEHDNMKAVIIAHEKEILKNEETRYAEIKEKLIGQTLRVNATVDSAYDTFLEGISTPLVKQFLATNKEQVIGIHSQSETRNLRLLKQSLWDFERVAANFLEEHWRNDEAMRSFASIFLALAIEHRAGRLLVEDDLRQLLEGSVLRALRRQGENSTTIVDEIEARYQTTRFDDTVVSPNLLVNAVLHGRVIKDEILESLAQSPHFAKPNEIPIWQRAWGYLHLTDVEVASIAAEFKQAFDSREFVERGIVYHGFGILLAFAELQIIPLSRAGVLAECKKYVDDLVTRGEVSTDLDREDLFGFGGSYAGFGFMERNTPEFQQAVKYYEIQADLILRGRYPDFAQEVMGMLESGDERFVLDLCLNNDRPSRFHDKPILVAISAEEFVENVLHLAPHQQRLAFNTLKDRHKFHSTDQDLALEKLWLIEVRDELKNQAKILGPVSNLRITHFVDACLQPAITRALARMNGPFR